MARFDQYLTQLHPNVQPLARMFLEEAYAAGLDPRVQEAFRSRDRQNQLYAQGRTAPGAIVTKARGGQSNHNYGVAFDVVPGALLSQKNWAPEDPRWNQLGAIAAKHGLEWGGNWKFVDKPHFQMKGANWRQLQSDPTFANFTGGRMTSPTAVAQASSAVKSPQVAGALGGIPARSVETTSVAPTLQDMYANAQAATFTPTTVGDAMAGFLQTRAVQQQTQAERDAADMERRRALFSDLATMYV